MLVSRIYSQGDYLWQLACTKTLGAPQLSKNWIGSKFNMVFLIFIPALKYVSPHSLAQTLILYRIQQLGLL